MWERHPECSIPSWIKFGVESNWRSLGYKVLWGLNINYCVLKTSRLCCSWLSFEHLAQWEDVAITTSNTIAWLREKSLYAWDCLMKCSIISCVLHFHDFIVASSWERKVGDVSKRPKLLLSYSWVNEDLVLYRSQMRGFGFCSLVWVSLFLYLTCFRCDAWCYR